MTEYKITGSPKEIWLNYGDIERDDTHENCAREGEITWCEESVFESDVKYIRADLVAELRKDAERYRWLCNIGMSLLHHAFAASSITSWKTKEEIDGGIDRARGYTK